MPTNTSVQEEFANIAAAEAAAAIQRKPGDIAGHKQILYDLKLSLCQEAVRLSGTSPDDELVWALAGDLPDFNVASLYRTRSSFLSLAITVFLGWFLGGMLATMLGFLGLGGEIWRPALILASLWLEEYLGANPKARKILLAVLGLGALGRFAASLAGGMVRLTGIGSIRQLIFGAGPRPNIFKSLWLWLGAFFLYIFFAKKIAGLDIHSFQTELAVQIEERLKMMCAIFTELDARDSSLAAYMAERNLSSDTCSKKNCELAKAAISMLDSLDAGHRRYLKSCLARAGYEVLDSDSDYLVWNSAVHSAEYETLGLARDGDRCRILERPHKNGDALARGLVQRVAS